MNIYYNGNYIFNVDMIETVNNDRLTGFNGIILHKGHKQVAVNLKYHMETAFKYYVERKEIQDITDEFFNKTIDDLIFKCLLVFGEHIESMCEYNENKMFLLDYFISEYFLNNIDKYFGGKNEKSRTY